MNSPVDLSRITKEVAREMVAASSGQISLDQVSEDARALYHLDGHIHINLIKAQDLNSGDKHLLFLLYPLADTSGTVALAWDILAILQNTSVSQIRKRVRRLDAAGYTTSTKDASITILGYAEHEREWEMSAS